MISSVVTRTKRLEGLRLKSYLCEAGYWTVGYGSTGKSIGPDTVWTLEQSEQNLRNRIIVLYKQCILAVPNCQGRSLEAIVSWTDNLGIARLLGSTMRKRFLSFRIEEGKREMARWVYAGGKISRGLVKRRLEDVSMINESDFF